MVTPFEATRSIAVVGELADAANLGDGGSSDVKSTTVVTPLTGLRSGFPDSSTHHATTLDDPADQNAVVSADLTVVVVGYTINDEGEYIDNAGTIELAADLFPPMDHPTLGMKPPARKPKTRDASTSAEPASTATDGSRMARGGDRMSLRLSPAHEQLVATAASLSDRVVVVVQSPRSPTPALEPVQPSSSFTPPCPNPLSKDRCADSSDSFGSR